MRKTIGRCLLSLLPLLVAFDAPAQKEAEGSTVDIPPAPPSYTPVTGGQRADWWADQSFGVRNWAVGAFTSSFWTWRDTPPEWGSGLSGFGRRYATRQAEVTLSTAAEASLGAAWGEDPRYFRSGRRKFWGRVGWAISSAFLAYRRDGERQPAWARGAAFVGTRAVTSTWRPQSEQTWWNYSLVPLGTGFGSKIAANLFVEFSGDIFRQKRVR